MVRLLLATAMAEMTTPAKLSVHYHGTTCPISEVRLDKLTHNKDYFTFLLTYF